MTENAELQKNDRKGVGVEMFTEKYKTKTSATFFSSIGRAKSPFVVDRRI